MLVSVPFTGLGLYGGFRGNRWLRNRIQIFCQFVIPSLRAQTDTDFIIWVTWRIQEKTNPYVIQLLDLMETIFGEDRVIFTYTGIPFWDDKYPNEEARERLFWTLKDAMPSLVNILEEGEVYWLLQPSDDCYHKETIKSVKLALGVPEVQAVTYTQGYIMNYGTLEAKEYNPKTNPPFFAIKFPKEQFIDPGKHINYTGPYKSHEYVGEKLRLAKFQGRGFIVGCHGENISTHFNNPFAGETTAIDLSDFGLKNVQPTRLPLSIRKWLMRKLPYGWQRKLRYWFGELLFSKFYNWIRS